MFNQQEHVRIVASFPYGCNPAMPSLRTAGLTKCILYSCMVLHFNHAIPVLRIDACWSGSIPGPQASGVLIVAQARQFQSHSPTSGRQRAQPVIEEILTYGQEGAHHQDRGFRSSPRRDHSRHPTSSGAPSHQSTRPLQDLCLLYSQVTVVCICLHLTREPLTWQGPDYWVA